MTIWMAWTLAVSILLAFSAMLITRVAFYFGIARRFIWAFGMLAAAAAPLLLPPRGLSLPWRSSSRVLIDARPATQPVDARASDASSAATHQSAMDWSAVSRRADPWIAGAWALWSCVLLVSLARAVAQLRRRRAEWKDVETEIGRVLVANDDGPAVVGWLRPRIVLPSWALAEDSSTQTLMLRHELEHFRAGDTRLLLLNEIVRRAFPWNAALWWMADRLRLAVEIDCDARVVRASGGAAHAYGLMLLAVSERLGCELPFAASQLVRGGDLERRLQVLGTERRRRPLVASVPYAAVALIVVTTAAWTPRPGFPARDRAVIAAVDSDLVRVGYEHRKQTAPPGFFIDSSQIDRSSGLFSDAFRGVPGLQISPSGDGRTHMIASADANGCVQVFVDGAPWVAQTPGDIDDFINPAKLIAVEMYHPQDRPPQFARPGAPSCAALVVWTQAIRGRRLKR